MTDPMKPIFADMADRFGLGSSTRGDAVLVNGKRTDANRSEAEARAARKVRCFAHETFERAERRKFREDRDRFNLAISMARSAIEDANLGADALKDFDGHISDHCGDFWNVDPRGEE